MTEFAYCYWSRPKDDVGIAQVYDIVEDSRKFNRRHAIHGMLIYDAIHFAQYIVGTGPKLHEAIRKIENSRRHEALQVLYHGLVNCPVPLNRWDMGFMDNVQTGIDTGNLSANTGQHDALLALFLDAAKRSALIRQK